MSVPRGFAAGIDVIMTILLVGAAWVVVDRIGTLRVVVGALVRRLKRPVVAIPVVSLFFGAMGAAENMQEGRGARARRRGGGGDRGRPGPGDGWRHQQRYRARRR
jgi:hypothetical protein